VSPHSAAAQVTSNRPWLVKAEWIIRREGIRPEHEPILTRLLTDPRMDDVWEQFTRRNRRGRTQFFYPAICHPGDRTLDAEGAQHRALCLLVMQAFNSARDKRCATPIEEVEEVQRDLLTDAATLRRIADETAESALKAGTSVRAHTDMRQVAMHIQALRNVAAWREADARHLRDSDDPSTTKYNRADPLIDGVQNDIAAFLQENFGNPMSQQAVIVAAVALGRDNVPSGRGSRSAVLRAKSARKKQSAS
jgi:hypothetical protein